MAERTAKFGLPEILFNLFPGMGGYSLLRRRVGERMAKTLIEDGTDAQCGRAARTRPDRRRVRARRGRDDLAQLVARSAGRFGTDLALKRVRQRTDLLSKAELVDIVDVWVELALGLGEAELRRMDCLARHQERRRARPDGAALSSALGR